MVSDHDSVAESAPPPRLGIAEDGEINLLSRFHPGNVRFRNLRLDGNGVQVSQFEDGRGCLGGDDSLPLFGNDADHDTIHGCDNPGVRQIGLGSG